VLNSSTGPVKQTVRRRGYQVRQGWLTASPHMTSQIPQTHRPAPRLLLRPVRYSRSLGS
jgi:hypothetical protein